MAGGEGELKLVEKRERDLRSVTLSCGCVICLAAPHSSNSSLSPYARLLYTLSRVIVLHSAIAMDSHPAIGGRDCLSCRIVGTGTLGITGLYALSNSRAHSPGSLWGKRAMAAVGTTLIVAAAIHWFSRPTSPRYTHPVPTTA